MCLVLLLASTEASKAYNHCYSETKFSPLGHQPPANPSPPVEFDYQCSTNPLKSRVALMLTITEKTSTKESIIMEFADCLLDLSLVKDGGVFKLQYRVMVVEPPKPVFKRTLHSVDLDGIGGLKMVWLELDHAEIRIAYREGDYWAKEDSKFSKVSIRKGKNSALIFSFS